ncbi:MAG: DNA-binding protein [Prevotellaceae bacterium]|jgi:predicted histone-like DNA-binding protein|nr:DNA-binding protein [Prevotellaceae bacterium]
MKYKLSSRANPQNRATVAKLFGSSVYAGMIDLKHISEELSAMSSLMLGDVYNVLISFVNTVLKYLRDGFKIQLGDFGIFKVSFSSEGVDEEKQFNTSLIRGGNRDFLNIKS